MFTATIEISDYTIACLLNCSVSVSHYWADINWDKSVAPTEEFKILDSEGNAHEFDDFETWGIAPGGKICITEKACHEDDEDVDHFFGREDIQRGLDLMAKINPNRFSDIIEDNMDATTGDVFLQCLVLGEERYG